ncbi:hypothetical protein D9758_011223 [Tetrapyrgos nigripes]|uniref:Uncharacterized protein n=1 Tax=Tetrapyrgos nigripes TaxID=182062 RepID=A0A8H5D7A4_9AGAR|nr:hypothetical protein D9758_011223 [Tetrapyrgos nigripes]
MSELAAEEKTNPYLLQSACKYEIENEYAVCKADQGHQPRLPSVPFQWYSAEMNAVQMIPSRT